MVLQKLHRLINFPVLKQEKGNGSLKSVQMLRGIASFMICYFHLIGQDPLFIPPDSWMNLIGMLGRRQCFFVISGFIIPYSMYKKGYAIQNLKQISFFLKKRIIRIWPPYIVSICMIIALTYLSALAPMYKGSTSVDWLNVLSHIVYLNAFTGEPWLNGAYWTLAIDFQFYFLMLLLFPFIISAKLYIRQIAILGLLATSFLPISIAHLFPSISYFIIGISFFLYFCKRINTLELFEYLSVCVLILLNRSEYWLPVLAVLTGVMIVQIEKVPKLFLKLGLISYSLYLIHMPVGGRMINIAARYTEHLPLYLRMFIALLVIFLCIVCSYCFYMVVEKRFKQLSAKISYK